MMIDMVSDPDNVLQKIPLYRFFLIKLNRIYSMELQLRELLFRLFGQDFMEDLTDSINRQLIKTDTYISRLRGVFEILNEDIEDGNGQDFFHELNSLPDNADESPVLRDISAIMLIRQAVHIGIASYDSLNALAEILGFEKVSLLLNTTIIDNYDSDLSLANLSRNLLKIRNRNEES